MAQGQPWFLGSVAGGLEGFEHMGHNAPDHQFVVFGHLYGWVVFVFRYQPHTVFFDLQPLYGKLPIDQAHRNLPVLGFQAAVYDQEVSIV